MAQHQRVPPLLLPEALGFVPQHLLDDIINIANSAILDGLTGMETFLEKWKEEREQQRGIQWDNAHEVEQGLVAFQTLLEYHTDVAFDFFEAWSLRNIFAMPPNLPIVLPHQEGLDLSLKPEEEDQLVEEIEDLRQKIRHQRETRRLFNKALLSARLQKANAEKQLKWLSAVDTLTMQRVEDLAPRFMTMYDGVSTLSTLDGTTADALSQFSMNETGKRLWETGSLGYVRWAVQQLISRSREGSNVTGMAEIARQIGSTESLQEAVKPGNDHF